jgi:hypothetical protein
LRPPGEFGYCTDALGDLVRAALMIVTSGRYAVVTFDGSVAVHTTFSSWPGLTRP